MNQITLSPFANFSSSVPWGLWVAVYVWLIGISCGAFFLAMLGNARGIANLKKITDLAISLSLAALSAGLLSILVDLGHIERFPKLFFEPAFSSVMAWMVWLYNLYFVILLAGFFLVKKEIPKWFSYGGAVFALLVISAESLLFALPPGRIWHSWVFSVHFVVSSLATGSAMLVVFGVILKKWLNKDYIDSVLAVCKALILFLLLDLALSFMEMSHIKTNLIPTVMSIVAIGGLLLPAQGIKALSALIAGIGILWGKFNILVLGQSILPYKGFREALIEPRLAQKYIPSIGEWIISLVLIAALVVIFFIVYQFILPLAGGIGRKEIPKAAKEGK